MAQKLHKFVFLIITSFSVLRKTVVATIVSDDSLTKDGDVVFGVLLPIYRKDGYNDCKVFNKDSLLWIRGITYALNELQNSKIPVFQNTSFGFNIKDSCSNPVLEQALDLVHSSKTNNHDKFPSRKIISVISSHYEKDSSTLLSLFQIPNMIIKDLDGGQVGISPMENGYHFEPLKVSFYRAKAVVGLLKHFNWDSVFVIVDDQYQKEFLMFKELAENVDICIAGIGKNYEEMTSMIERSLDVRTLVMFTDGISMLKAMRDIKSRRPSHYTWIDVIGNAETMTSEFIMTGEAILSLRAEFKFLNELRRYSNPDCGKKMQPKNQSLSELCKIDQEGFKALEEVNQVLDSRKSALALSKIAQDRTKDIQGVLNGFFTIGKALVRHMEAHCWDKTKDECMELISGKDIANELVNLTRKQFLENTSLQKPLLKENIFSLISIHGNTSTPREVGTWENTWFINNAGIRWPGKQSYIPVSTCSPQCPAGFVQVSEEGRKCCWSCQSCNYNQYITDNYTCTDCLRGYWPSIDFRTCEFKIHITVMSCAMAISSVSAVLYALVL